MDFCDSPSEAIFRKEAHEFLAANIHEAPGDLSESAGEWEKSLAARKKWQRILYENGFAAITWPEAHGGRGLGPVEQIIWNEERNRARAPSPVNIVGIGMAGPALIEHGTDEQRERYLSRILSGEEIWCQLFSEPDAGSDLAAVATKAERDGDDWIVTGQKVWSSGAHFSRRAILLARTDPTVPKHRGITFFALDMESPGVTVRPLRQMNGEIHFNEVFLDEVRVPVDQLVGQENQGWTVAKSLLEFERLKLARIGENKRRMARAREVGLTRWREGRRVADWPWYRARFADLRARLIALEANTERFVARQMAGEQIGPEVSMLKLRGSRLIQQWEELIVDALGPEAAPLSPHWLQARPGAAPLDALAGTASSRRFLARGYTIAGGSSEIQHNILAKQVLGL